MKGLEGNSDGNHRVRSPCHLSICFVLTSENSQPTLDAVKNKEDDLLENIRELVQDWEPLKLQTLLLRRIKRKYLKETIACVHCATSASLCHLSITDEIARHLLPTKLCWEASKFSYGKRLAS